MIQNFAKWMLGSAVAALVTLGYSTSAHADGYYFHAPSYYVAPPVAYYEPAYLVPAAPVVVYPAPVVYSRPTIVYSPVVTTPVRTPLSPYGALHRGYFSPYYAREKFKARRGKVEYEYKLYSPYRLGSVYEFEYKNDHGRIEIEEDFD